MSLVLFDLDGTLVDTAHDLGVALNLQLVRHGKLALSQDLIRPVASHGTVGLLGLGFGITPADADFEAKRIEYLDLYESVFTDNPLLLPGIAELLSKLDAQGIKWGIVTNKPRRFSVDLIKAVKHGGASLYEGCVCLVCGDDALLPKPAPDTLLMACTETASLVTECIYVGDAERDIQAGRAAGMKTIVALFGYIAMTDKPEQWGADAMISHPMQLMAYLD